MATDTGAPPSRAAISPSAPVQSPAPVLTYKTRSRSCGALAMVNGCHWELMSGTRTLAYAPASYGKRAAPSATSRSERGMVTRTTPPGRGVNVDRVDSLRCVAKRYPRSRA